MSSVKWIPTKEKLPEKSGSYLVTIRDNPNQLYVVEAEFYPSRKYFWGDEPMIRHWVATSGEYGYTLDEVIAWAYMPKPYKVRRTNK